MTGKSCIEIVFAATLLSLAGCGKTAQTPTSAETKLDPCTLITSDEIAAIQKSPVKEAKSSVNVSGGFRVSQCFYTTEPFNKSVVLNVTQTDPDHPTNRTPKDVWKETFGQSNGGEKEREHGNEEEEQRAAPKRIDGVGDEAYWTGIRFGGVLYVLKKDRFIRISVGGGDTEESKINSSKALARKAIERL